MADFTQARLSNLTEETVNDLTYFIVIDDSDFAEAKKISVSNFLEPEATQRETDDETIRDAVGLETDYTYLPDETTNYLKSVDFTDAGINASVIGATQLLDAKIYELEGSLFLRLYVTLTKAQLEAIFTSPVPVLTAPANYFLNLHDYLGKNLYTAGAPPAAWTAGADTLDLVSNSVVLGKLSNAFIEATSAYVEKGTVERGIKLEQGVTTYLKSSSADFTGGNAGISIRLVYEIISDAFTQSTTTTSGCCNIPVTGSFTNADLNGSSMLVIEHNQGSEFVLGVVITDPNGVSELKTFQLGDGDNAYVNKDSFITLDFGGAIANGTWTYYFTVVNL